MDSKGRRQTPGHHPKSPELQNQEIRHHPSQLAQKQIIAEAMVIVPSHHHHDKGEDGNPLGPNRDGRHLQGAGDGPDDADSQEHAEVTEAADDEGLDGGPVGGPLAADSDQAVHRDQKAFQKKTRGTKLSARTAPLAMAAARKT